MQEQATEQWAFLTGWPPIEDFVNFVSSHSVGGQEVPIGPLLKRWGEANNRVLELTSTEGGEADRITTAPLSADLAVAARTALANPVLAQAFGAAPTTIEVVELERLVVFQRFINLRYVEELRRTIPTDASALELFQVAIPLSAIGPAARIGRASGNTWVAVSPSGDFRFLGPALLMPEGVSGYPSSGYPSAVLSLGLGYGSNVLNAIRVNGRLVLNNGSHRAYALYEAGVRHVACVIQDITRREELGLIVGGDLAAAPDKYLVEPRPPLLRDYFDERLRTVLDVPRMNRQIKISFGIEQMDVPAT